VRFSDDADLCRRYAEELVALAPDVLVASASLSVAAFQRVTRSVPIVFANVIDPVGADFVSRMARPGPLGVTHHNKIRPLEERTTSPSWQTK
jgi:ABC-type uncharacterized transport system substrate-binding protein